MLKLYNDLLQCLGRCQSLELSPGVAWEYTIAPEFPSIADLEGDRLYCQSSLLSISTDNGIDRGRFRFTVYGGIGSVGSLVAMDVRDRIAQCLGCRVRVFDLQISEVQFPKKNSDRMVSIAILSFRVVG